MTDPKPFEWRVYRPALSASTFRYELVTFCEGDYERETTEADLAAALADRPDVLQRIALAVGKVVLSEDGCPYYAQGAWMPLLEKCSESRQAAEALSVALDGIAEQHAAAVAYANALVATEAERALQARVAELEQFRGQWDREDGNTPGYNRQKARRYGDLANEYRIERDALQARMTELETRQSDYDGLEGCVGALTTERDALQARVADLTGESQRWADTCQGVRNERDQLTIERNAARVDRDAALEAQKRAEATLSKVNEIRNSIVGTQSCNWSAHVYPLVAVQNEFGLVGETYDVARCATETLFDRAEKAEQDAAGFKSAFQQEANVTSGLLARLNDTDSRLGELSEKLKQAEQEALRLREQIKCSESDFGALRNQLEWQQRRKSEAQAAQRQAESRLAEAMRILALYRQYGDSAIGHGGDTYEKAWELHIAFDAREKDSGWYTNMPQLEISDNLAAHAQRVDVAPANAQKAGTNSGSEDAATRKDADGAAPMASPANSPDPGQPPPHAGSVDEGTGIAQFAQLRAADVARCVESYKCKLDDWSTMEWACAVAGEAGEVCGAAKKLWRGTGSKQAVMDELADTIIYADLLAAHLGCDLWDAVVSKFNERSKEIGSPYRIGAPEQCRGPLKKIVPLPGLARAR